MKKHLTIAVLLLVTLSLQAQQVTFWQKVHNFLNKAGDIDTTRIYYPQAGFTLGLFATGQKSGLDLDVSFVTDLGEEGMLTGETQYNISESLCKKIGLEVGYGKVSLGYGIEVGPRSASKKSALAFNILGRMWGAHLNYYKITNPFNSGVTIGNEAEGYYVHDEFISSESAVLRSLMVDGYYVFNNKRFAYPAAYKRGFVQRHTAGSWMLTARYNLGDLYTSPEAALDSYNLLDCFSTMQASVGGGYSVNFVFWHKDPVDDRDKGLRNLTLNLTAMPVITLFNYLKTTSYEYEEGHYNGNNKVSKVWCYPMPNFIGSAAAGLTLGRFYFSTQFTFNDFYFRRRDALNSGQVKIPGYVDKLDYQGLFHDWMLKGLLVYKF